VAARAREVVAITKQMRELAKAASDPFAGEITLGAFPTLAPYLLPYIMPTLRKEFPKLTVRLVEEKTAVLTEQLRAGSIDAALIALPVMQTDIETIALFEEPFLLAVPKNHLLAKHKTLAASELHNHELLLLDDGHCLREQALQVCSTIGAKESQSFRATSLETLRHMVASGMAATLMPKLAVEADKDITYITLTDPTPYRTIGLCFRKSSPRHALMEGLATAIKQSFSHITP
jgi:LysR family hydrogen peroxide-inducible transcriptional activator